MSSVTMTVSMERALRAACTEMGESMLTALTEHYEIDMEEMRRVCGLSDLVVTKAVKKAGAKKARANAPKKAKKEMPSVPMPFVGFVDETCCYGIRLNHGLHTQCTMEKIDGKDYCKTCVKHAEKNASGKPAYGDIRDRKECGLLEFRDPKGKQTLPYINVVEKLGLDMDAVKAEAAKFGIDIPDEHLVKRETKRGRPKKDVTDVSDTDSEASKPKKRGRPRKEKVIESVVDDDLLAALKNAQADAKPVVKQQEDASSVTSEKSNKSNKSGGRPRLSDEEKAARKAAKEAAKEAEKKRKAEAKAIAKAAKDAEKEAEKKRKAEAKAAAKAEKEAAKEAEKKRKAEAKATAKAKKVTDTTPVEEENFSGCAAGEEMARAVAMKEKEEMKTTEPVKEDEEDEDAEALHVKKFELNGKIYLRTADNVLYDIETQEPVGIYDPETGEIEDVEAVSDDEEEEDDE